MSQVNSYDRESYTTNGVAKSFSFGWNVNSKDDVKIQFVNAKGEIVDSAKFIDANDDEYTTSTYNFTVELNRQGGQIVFVDTPAEDQYLIIYRQTPLVYENSFKTATAFPAAAIDKAYRKIWLALQEVQSDVIHNTVRMTPNQRGLHFSEFSEDVTDCLVYYSDPSKELLFTPFTVTQVQNTIAIAQNIPSIAGDAAEALNKATAALTIANNAKGEAELARQDASNAVQIANGKQDLLVSGVNIKTINGQTVLGSGDLTVTAVASWGSIIGDIDDQTDLKNALDSKANTTDIGDATLSIQKNGTTVDTFTANATVDKTINITVPTQASDVNALPDSTKYGASLSLTINSSTYVITAQLKDQDGNNLGSAQTIDLPLESVVVSGSYDSATKEVVLTLQNGSTIRFSVADLVSGLQAEITVNNMLNADLVDDSTSTNKFVTSSDITTWNAKQNTLTAGANISIENDVISSTAQESFFRGNFSTWENVPTNVNGYKENYKHEKTPTFGDFMVVADASDYVNPDFSDDPENVAFQRNPNAFTINIIVGNNTISVCYSEIQNNYKTIRELFTSKGYTGIGCEWLKLKYTPGSPGQWYITSTSNYYENNELVSANTDHLLMNTNEPVISMFYLSRNAGVAPIALFGGWRFSYYGIWATDGKNGWKPEYQVEDVLPVASSTIAGIMKLYPSIGTHIDGTITQNGIKTQLDTKQDTISATDGITLTGTTLTNSGVRAVASGTANGTISVNTNGTSADVAVYGLGSAAYTASTDYATSAQGAKADTAVQPGDLATVATTGDYDDLLNKPTIPAAQVNSDWNANSGVAEILNKPTLGTMAAESASDYTPTASLAAVALSGAYSDLSGTPSLATVATSGDYDDLLNKPTIPTVNDATLTIQKNGTNVATFTANASSAVTANISVPTDTNDLTNGAGYITGITSGDVTTALGYTPYSDANPNGYTSNVGTVTSVNNASPDGSGNVSLTIPTVNDATITITQGGVTKGSFTLNQSSGDTIALDAGGGTTYTAGDGITITGSTIAVGNIDCGTLS